MRGSDYRYKECEMINMIDRRWISRWIQNNRELDTASQLGVLVGMGYTIRDVKEKMIVHGYNSEEVEKASQMLSQEPQATVA